MAEVKVESSETRPAVAPTRSSLQPQPKEDDKPEKERAAAVTKSARTKKHSRLKEAFFGEHADNIGEYIIFDVAIPALKATVEDMFGQGLHMLFYGETKKKSSSNGRVAYGSYYRERESSAKTSDRERSRGMDDILFDDERTANDVLDGLFARCEKYDCATVLDLFDLAGLTAGSYMDDNYGWFMRDLRSARVRRVYDRRDVYYMIDLPRPVRVV